MKPLDLAFVVVGMNVRLSMLSACLVFAVLQFGASAPSYADNGSSRAFKLHVRSANSARTTFRAAMRSLHTLSAVRLVSAFSDRGDTFVQGFFMAKYQNRPVAGALLAGKNGTAVGAFDLPERAGHTVPAMLAHQLPSSSARRASAVAPLHPVSFGSGTIGLPDTWRVLNSYQGCVEAGSTHDHGYLGFGCPQTGFAPPTLPGADPRTVLVLPYSDVVSMFRAYAQIPLPAGLGFRDVRIAEAQRVSPPAGTGEAAYVLFDYRLAGAAYRGLALINVAPVDAHSYMLYKSMFMLPSQTFARLAPTMWKSWQSWGVNSNVLNQRLFDAAKTMRETGDIITGGYWERQQSGDRSSHAFDQYIRDTATLEHTSTGERWEGNWNAADAIVKMRPTEYRIVPLSDL